MTTKRTKKQVQILDAATQLFLKQGYAKTSIREVVEATGVSRETVYTNFQNKAGLFAAVIDDLLDDVHAPIEDTALETLPIKEGLREVAQQSIALLLGEKSVSMARLAFSETAHHREVGQLYFEHAPKRGFKRLAHLLKHHQNQGAFPASDVDRAAEYFWSMLFYKSKMERYCGITKVPNPQAIQAHAKRVVDDFLYFYRACDKPRPSR